MRKDLGKTWADAYYEKLAGGVQVYSTWANFVAALEEAFPEHRTRIKAHQILMKLPERQRDRKTALSLSNYVTRFEQLASKAQLKDAEVNGTNRIENDYHTLHANFVKGLLKELPGTTKYETLTQPNRGLSLSQTPETMANQWISTPLPSHQPSPPYREEGNGN
ncbi:predicted protein [Postia placenta Mad-698-R]|nr:predicted protein [Postia placenta Mad-698-R]